MHTIHGCLHMQAASQNGTSRLCLLPGAFLASVPPTLGSLSVSLSSEPSPGELVHRIWGGQPGDAGLARWNSLHSRLVASIIRSQRSRGGAFCSNGQGMGCLPPPPVYHGHRPVGVDVAGGYGLSGS